MPGRYCVFCEIIAHREPARIHYEDDDVVVFENILGWSRVMLLVVPREHKSQSDLWADLGPAGRVAVEQGGRHAPEGFRVLANFGPWGMQSQPHGHLHVLDQPDRSLMPPSGEPAAPVSIVARVRATGRELHRTADAVVFDARQAVADGPPITALALPAGGDRPAVEFWRDVGAVGAEAVRFAWAVSGPPVGGGGFRLLANFPAGDEAPPGGEQGHLYVLGGTFLGHYV